MKNVRKIAEDLYWVGASDRRLALFENIYPLRDGVSYNSYLYVDEKTVLLDTVDHSVSRQFLENIKGVLGERALDYVIVNHMEPDHCAVIEELILRYPKLQIIGNAKTIGMVKQFYDFEVDSRAYIVKEGDTFSTGKHELKFVMAPMVHWPEVMVTYDMTEGILFSADAFGSFGALSGNVFADETEFCCEQIDEARRYYTNIVGKYGMQVQALLKKASALEIKMICPLHGLIWRENIEKFVEKYQMWSTYTAEENSVLIVYGSVYGNTENAAEVLAGKLADQGIKHIKVYDISKTDISYVLADTFKYSHIVFAAATYNNGIFTPMETLLHDLKAHNVQNRTVALIENGSWAPASGKQMAELIAGLKNVEVLEEKITIKSALKDNQEEMLDKLAQKLVESLKK